MWSAGRSISCAWFLDFLLFGGVSVLLVRTKLEGRVNCKFLY